MATLTASVGRGAANKSADVLVVQSLLNQRIGNLGLAHLTLDSVVGPKTLTAIEAFQRVMVGMPRPDGRVDPNGRTFRELDGSRMADKKPGVSVSKPAPNTSAPSQPVSSGTASSGRPVAGAVRSPAWPPKPAFAALTSNEQRAKVFGRFQYVAAPLKGNPENIRILGDWATKNIETVTIDMGPHLGTKHVQFHKLASQQLQGLWKAWADAGLLDRVLGYSGSFVPRFVRGSTKNLSNHSFGSAFDINVPWNERKHQPALLGDKGCVRELVPIANAHGFYWGGHFSILDGMHFEVAKLM